MKKTLLLAAALACSGAVAQEKEIWACQMDAGTMLKWRNDTQSWQSLGIIPYNLLLTINGDGSGMEQPSDRPPTNYLSCEKVLAGKISCMNNIKTKHYLLDSDTGKLGISDLIGAISREEKRSDPFASVFNCTKF